MTPTWARPFAPPEDNASPMRGRGGSPTVSGALPTSRRPARKGLRKWKEAAMIVLRGSATGSLFRSLGFLGRPGPGPGMREGGSCQGLNLFLGRGTPGVTRAAYHRGFGFYQFVVLLVLETSAPSKENAV